MSMELVVPSNHLILCHPLLLFPSIFPSIRVFSNESAVCIRWPKCWSFSISPSSEYSGLISLRINWFALPAVQRTLNYISWSLRFLSWRVPASTILQFLLFYFCKNPHWLLSSAQHFPLGFLWMILLVITTCIYVLEQGCQYPLQKNTLSQRCPQSCVALMCPGTISESVHQTSWVAKARVLLPNAGRVMWTSQTAWGLRWNGWVMSV